ncbi:MAG: transcription-repair coupling factor [Deltaproteobacteria bacterium]|nr:transcription-repair coupling factor [Deltaproteobacteria bacterium]MBW2395783.1 transcription-repair coupling factor [Deltaproteobacteria bacterium]
MAEGDLQPLAERLARGVGPRRLMGLRGGARAAVLARLVQAAGSRTVLVLTAGAKETDRVAQDLASALGETTAEEGGRVRTFPHPDTPPYDRFSPQPFVVAQRLDILFRLADPAADEPGPIIVAPWAALAGRVPAREVVRARSVRLDVGTWIDRDELVATLVSAGYTRQPLVEERGEVAVRGGLVDVFPPQRARPVRIELLGDEVESLREFDPASQRSAVRLERLVAAPAREILGSRELVVERSGAIRERGMKQGIAVRKLDALLDGLLRGSLPPGVEAMAPLLQPAMETLFDALPDDTLVVVDEPAAGHDALLHADTERLENWEGTENGERVVCTPDELALGFDEVRAEIERREPILLERLEALAGEPALTLRSSPQDELSAALRTTRADPATGDALRPLVETLARWCDQGLRVVLSASALSGADRLHTLLGEYGVASRLTRERAPLWEWSAAGEIEVRIGAVSEGFVLPDEGLAVATEDELFGPRERRRRPGSWREGAAVEALGQLTTGDFLVHAEHGIGIYRGLVMLELGRFSDEFLRIEYDDGDRLFVPVHRLNLIQRYVGSEGGAPKVDKLGGTTWEKTKRKVKRSMRDMAKQLLDVHAARELAPGVSFPGRNRALEEFEAAFPFEETPDQAAAIEDVIVDLVRDRPMDRLVCGDVGYGKTEVACRGAFQVVMAGKQVAVLVPTTILCQQHVETFEERFRGTGARVESLSRFRSPKQAKKVLEGLADGSVDIVIGTHRLLQKNMSFRDLGLLVVDEEHRFGVAHKERIKELKKTVDVLTLTATPIPRTLQMAFSGLRDLSVIQTPPADRLAIRTQVCRFEESLIREAILREVRRGGQVFFVHNRVRTIGALAEFLERLVPEVKILVAHGQMPERELEDRMLAFMRGDHDVLLCTTIVESGLDIPRANTMLIDRADALGLAQLYQLRGRVGRSRKRAYAYLLIPGEAALTANATRRLEAIQDLTALGSGFRLANMDLEIRGAGNLLGGEQSGSLGAVGYETYMELLEESIAELRGSGKHLAIDPEIRLPVAARLPEAYVADVSQRLVLYKRLASAPDLDEARRLREELLDRFGPLPEEAEHLVQVIELKVRARELGVIKIEIERGALVLTAAESSQVDPARLVDWMNASDPEIEVLPDHRIRAKAPDKTAAALFQRTHWLLDQLSHPS